MWKDLITQALGPILKQLLPILLKQLLDNLAKQQGATGGGLTLPLTAGVSDDDIAKAVDDVLA